MFENFNTQLIGATTIVAGLGGMIVGLVRTLPMKIWNFLRDRYGYSLSLDSHNNTQGYGNLNYWLLGLNKSTINNHINVKRMWVSGKEICYNSLDYGIYFILYKKSIININKTRSDKEGSDGVVQNDYMNINIFGFSGKKIKEEILEYINKNDNLIETEKYKDSIEIFIKDGYNFRRKIVKKRTEDTIFNPNIKKITDHLDKWLINKQTYERLGIPYKTGILLYGKPGTGKSSLAKFIASYLNYKLYLLDDVTGLESVCTQVQEKSVILMEDIDCTMDNKRKSNNNKDNNFLDKMEEISQGTLLGKVLNILDGITSPENVVFIATTNCIDKLDDALTRKGRFDLVLEIDNLDQEYGRKMCESFNLPEDVIEDILSQYEDEINPSDLQVKILENI